MDAPCVVFVNGAHVRSSLSAVCLSGGGALAPPLPAACRLRRPIAPRPRQLSPRRNRRRGSRDDGVVWRPRRSGERRGRGGPHLSADLVLAAGARGGSDRDHAAVAAASL